MSSDENGQDSEVVALLREQDGPVRWESPPRRVWEAIAAKTSEEPVATVSSGDLAAPTGDLPAPTGELAGPAEPSGTRAFSRRALLGWLGSAAAGVALGVAGVRLWSGRQDAEQVVSAVPLTTLDTRVQRGRAEVVRDEAGLSLRVHADEPFSNTAGYVEVWLINRDLERMVSVGVWTGRRDEAFPIDQALLERGYVIVDLSRELFNGAVTHSGDSIVRGALPV